MSKGNCLQLYNQTSLKEIVGIWVEKGQQAFI